MAFNNLTEFLAMGTHGAYVWSAYGFSVLALIWLVWNTLSTRQKTRNILRKRLLRNQNR
ncbi:heme exporter protein CcmD [Marinomonas sp. M1K-6]|uniref:Heme exporter protein D n=1 Tax=Marinomonas profundi TaxID=2726122 RepID=A0A847QV29_9GAMM|nr:heme exporter protein CcmD [Marinomonas profundi]NLQ16568.1 heme exporter protein CcmD [Marinomonas profundi]UDV03845.1 heme exporter protein CcmD [Marinomonas profundi]